MKDNMAIFKDREKETSKFTDLRFLIETSINRMFNIRDIFEGEFQAKGVTIDLPEGYPPMLYIKNCHYIVGIYKLLNSGLCNSAGSLMRTVIEDIWVMYFTAFGDTKDIEQYHKCRYHGFYTSYDIDSLKGTYDKDVTKKICREYSYSKICGKVYEPDTKEIMYKELYGKLSDDVHSSITGIIKDMEFTLDRVKEFYENLLNLIYNNVAAIFEIYQSSYLIEYESEVFSTLGDIARYFNNRVIPFSPDSEEMKKRFVPAHKFLK